MRIIKNNYRRKRAILIIATSILLFACSGDKRVHDLQVYIHGLKKAIIKHKKAGYISEIKAPIPVVFQATEKQRDPFNDEQASYYSDKSSLNNPLLAYPARQFEYMGTITREQQVWAVVKAPDNKVYQVTIKDRIGDHYGRIVNVYSDRLEIEEGISGSEAQDQKDVKKIISLPLKGKS
ncbi:MAG TPA: pilus assembly protein PilP [Gammaproteobacteria bacterium]|nr:pilus assembly protein PilP [Gammaproteobacteria bacterium]